MPTRDSAWPTGTPCWIDMMAPDPVEARTFYTRLFGWEWQVGPAETGYYATALQDGQAVCGLGSPMQEGVPAVWTVYLATDDIDATQSAITAAGGTVVAPAMQVMEHGSMLVANDPQGNTFAAWQGNAHKGFGVYNEDGADVWNELMTADDAAGQKFLSDVFGATFAPMGAGAQRYSMMNVDGNTVGGVGEAAGDTPKGWRSYISVADCDATLAKAVEIGATIVSAAADMPFGRWGVFADPWGAQLSVVAPQPMTADD